MTLPSPSPLSIVLPDWLSTCVAESAPFDDDEKRMALVNRLAHRNVLNGGSPFGAAVFAGNEIVAAGVNCVLSSGFSIAHAEIVALMHAQSRIHHEETTPAGPYTLYSSAEPCCQCFGAIFWSGVDMLVYGADRTDVEAVGFDEGPKPTNWAEELANHHIRVRHHVNRPEANVALQEYARRGGPIYGRNRGAIPQPPRK